MPKYYKKKYYRGSRDKYSVEQSAAVITTNETGDGGQIVVPAITTQGMRKVKHLTVSIAHRSASTNASSLYWALVYVPQGTGVGSLSLTGNLYEPNQFVMCCGVFDFDGGPLRVHCPTSRNLNSGDSVALILKNVDGAYTYDVLVRYAVTLQ